MICHIIFPYLHPLLRLKSQDGIQARWIKGYIPVERWKTIKHRFIEMRLVYIVGHDCYTQTRSIRQTAWNLASNFHDDFGWLCLRFERGRPLSQVFPIRFSIDCDLQFMFSTPCGKKMSNLIYLNSDQMTKSRFIEKARGGKEMWSIICWTFN